MTKHGLKHHSSTRWQRGWKTCLTWPLETFARTIRACPTCYLLYILFIRLKHSVAKAFFLYITYHTKPSANGFLYLNPCKLNVSSPAYTFLDIFFSIVMVLCCSTGLVKCNGEMVGFIKSAVQVWMEDKKPKAMKICICFSLSLPQNTSMPGWPMNTLALCSATDR